MSKSTEEIKADIETGVDQIKELCSMVPITPEENILPVAIKAGEKSIDNSL